MQFSKVKKDRRFLRRLSVMSVLSVLIVLITGLVDRTIYEPFRISRPVPAFASFEPVLLEHGSEEIEAVYLCLDENENLVAYAVDTAEYGFNSQLPIRIRSLISADGNILFGIEVLEQHESHYYGDRITLSSFLEQFKGRLFPVLLSSESGRGSHIDGLSGATYSTGAVIRSIRRAQSFIEEHFLS